MEQDTFNFAIDCVVCNQNKTVVIPATSLNIAKHRFKEILSVLDHPANPKDPSKGGRCPGQWNVFSPKK